MDIANGKELLIVSNEQDNYITPTLKKSNSRFYILAKSSRNEPNWFLGSIWYRPVHNNDSHLDPVYKALATSAPLSTTKPTNQPRDPFRSLSASAKARREQERIERRLTAQQYNGAPNGRFDSWDVVKDRVSRLMLELSQFFYASGVTNGMCAK